MAKYRLLFPQWPQGGVDRPTVDFGKSLTRQSDAESADINVIMNRFEKTGVMPVNAREAVFADVSQIGSFRDAQDAIIRGQEAFMALPAAVRARFENDPVQLMDFASDPANLPELVKLGLVEAAAAAVEPPAAAGPPSEAVSK